MVFDEDKFGLLKLHSSCLENSILVDRSRLNLINMVTVCLW